MDSVSSVTQGRPTVAESMSMTQILSIQSAVAYGFAGNSAAIFPLRRLGVDAWPVLTVNFSNHTGYGAWRGPHIAASDVWQVVQGVDDRGVLAECDAVLSGYLGAADIGQVVLDAVDLTRSRNPKAVYCADPVMGDVGRGFYVGEGIPEFMREHQVPRATIMTPNLFELEFLTGRTTNSLQDVIEAAQELRSKGPSTVLVTSVAVPGHDANTVRMLALDGAGCFLVETPLIDRSFTGTGDLTTAVFLAHWLRGEPLQDVLSATASVVYSVLDVTNQLGRYELALVQAQDDIVTPRHTFQAVPV